MGPGLSSVRQLTCCSPFVDNFVCEPSERRLVGVQDSAHLLDVPRGYIAEPFRPVFLARARVLSPYVSRFFIFFIFLFCVPCGVPCGVTSGVPCGVTLTLVASLVSVIITDSYNGNFAVPYLAPNYSLTFEILEVRQNHSFATLPPVLQERHRRHHLPALEGEKVRIMQPLLILPLGHHQQVEPPFEALGVLP